MSCAPWRAIQHLRRRWNSSFLGSCWLCLCNGMQDSQRSYLLLLSTPDHPTNQFLSNALCIGCFLFYYCQNFEEIWSTRYYSDIRSQISGFTFPSLEMPNLTLLPESDRKRFHNLRFLDPSSDLHSNSSLQCSINPTFFRFLYPTVSIPSHQCEEKQ